MPNFTWYFIAICDHRFSKKLNLDFSKTCGQIAIKYQVKFGKIYYYPGCLTSPPVNLYIKNMHDKIFETKKILENMCGNLKLASICMPLSALRIIQEKWFLTTCSCESLRFFGHIFTTHKWFYFYLRCGLGDRGRIRCRIRGRGRCRRRRRSRR